jgi:hypothetical protein
LPEPGGEVVRHILQGQGLHGAGVRRDPRQFSCILIAPFRMRLFTAVQPA